MALIEPAGGRRSRSWGTTSSAFPNRRKLFNVRDATHPARCSAKRSSQSYPRCASWGYGTWSASRGLAAVSPRGCVRWHYHDGPGRGRLSRKLLVMSVSPRRLDDNNALSITYEATATCATSRSVDATTPILIWRIKAVLPELLRLTLHADTYTLADPEPFPLVKPGDEEGTAAGLQSTPSHRANEPMAAAPSAPR